MAKLYYTLVKAGTWKIEQVPNLWRAEVERMIEADKAAA